MRKLAYLFLTALVFACGPKTETTETTAETVSIAPPDVAPPQLTEEQKADGWVALFDGQTMNGWRTFKNKVHDNWEVAGGALHSKPVKENGENTRADIISENQYENFELMFDWAISPQGNSGVIYRVSEDYDVPFATGPEFQVLDDEGYPGDLKDVQLSGTNYDMQPTSGPKKLSPVGQWNTSKIVVNGNHVEHWLNGDKVVEYELNSESWKQMVAGSKWKDFPAYGTMSKGHIDLQDHGNEVWFTNIFIKEL